MELMRNESHAEFEERVRVDERAKVIDEIINKCTKEPSLFDNGTDYKLGTICKIWLSQLKKLKEYSDE